MDKTKFMSFYLGSPSEKNASACFDAISAALTEIGINTPLVLAGALATVRVEVGRAFLPIEEYASGQAYENRHDLGNYVPGDGTRYKGRGFIQLTGRANYQNYSNVIGVDIICHPDKALDPIVSAKIFAHYFKDRGCDIACSSKNWTQVRKLVNGGYNGLADFISIVNQYNS